MAENNYQVRLLDLLESGELVRLEPGQLKQINIYHDDWCAIFHGGACNCNPEVVADIDGQQEAPAGKED
jgi:hypothetical protein